MLIINKRIFDKNKIKRLIIFYFRILVINFLCSSQSFFIKNRNQSRKNKKTQYQVIKNSIFNSYFLGILIVEMK